MAMAHNSQNREGPTTDAGDPPTTLIGRIFRTFEILASEPLTAAELGRKLGVNRSTALRLLTELIDTSYVVRDPETKRFALVPPRFLNLIARQDRHTDWTQIIDPMLAEIRDETGDSTILGVPANQTMVYLAFFPTFHVLAVSERLGTMRPMHCSALGKAYLSALDDAALEHELSLMSYVGGTEQAAQNSTQLRIRVMQARQDGYAFDVDETFDQVRCVAAPVRIGGSLVGAVGISGPAGRLSISRMRELGRYLIQRMSAL
jgi:DNA-binding IclR family transcriptional regulator